MTRTVLDVLDQVLALAEGLDDEPDDLDIRLFVVAADVVDLAVGALVQHGVDRRAVVGDVQPVADLHAVAVDGQRLAGLAVVDHQRNELFGELIGTVVVGAARDVDGHTERLVIGSHHHVGARLGRRIGAVGRERRGLLKHAGLAERTVHLVGRNLQVLDAVPVVARILVVGRELPKALCHIKERLGADDIGRQKDLRLGDGAVNMALRRKVDNGVDVVGFKDLGQRGSVAYIRLDKGVARIVFDVAEVIEVAGVGQRVDIDDVVVVIFEHVMDEVGADKARAARYQNIFHVYLLFRVKLISDTMRTKPCCKQTARVFRGAWNQPTRSNTVRSRSCSAPRPAHAAARW